MTECPTSKEVKIGSEQLGEIERERQQDAVA